MWGGEEVGRGDHRAPHHLHETLVYILITNKQSHFNFIQLVSMIYMNREDHMIIQFFFFFLFFFFFFFFCWCYWASDVGYHPV